MRGVAYGGVKRRNMLTDGGRQGVGPALRSHSIAIRNLDDGVYGVEPFYAIRERSRPWAFHSEQKS